MTRKSYAVALSTSLAAGVFLPCATNLPATPPVNVFTDAVMRAEGFYRSSEH